MDLIIIILYMYNLIRPLAPDDYNKLVIRGLF